VLGNSWCLPIAPTRLSAWFFTKRSESAWSPRTVRAYWPEDPFGDGKRSTRPQHWRTFVRNHAQAIVACDFLVAVTARFQLLYILVVMEIGSRRIIHCNVTAHPSALWTMQQLREAIPSDHQYRFLIHDRDSIFSAALDRQVGALGLRLLRTPVRAPKANATANAWWGQSGASAWII
jgi:putative transposase